MAILTLKEIIMFNCKATLRVVLICGIFFFSEACVVVEIQGPRPKVRDIIYGDYVESQRLTPQAFIEYDGSQCPDGNLDSHQLYLMTGEQLRDCMKEDSVSILYLWSFGCSSPDCVSPELVQSFSDRYNAELYVLSLRYKVAYLSSNISIELPLFAINTRYYATEIESRYQKLFFRDLLARKTDRPQGLYYVFRHGQFDQAFHSLDELVLYMSS